MRRTYLDWAAAAPVSKASGRAFQRALAAYGNPSSPHAEGREAKALLEDARLRIARLAGTKREAVIFTGGATEANALGILGHIRALMDGGRAPEAMHVLYLPSAHASVLGAVRMLGNAGVRTESLRIRDGRMDLERLRAQLTPDTVLISIDLVCGETGVIHKARDVRRVIDAYAKEKGAGPALHIDASQAPLAESFELTHLGADMVVLDAQKVGGVRGIGCLIAPRIALAPLIEGGGQERGLRPGTESPALAQAFAAALEETDRERAAFTERAAFARSRIVARLGELPHVEVNEGKQNAPHMLNLSICGRDTDYLATLLDARGYAVSTKSACETDSAGSRAVLALTGDAERSASTLRVSWGPSTDDRALSRFADALIEAVRFLDANPI